MGYTLRIVPGSGNPNPTLRDAVTRLVKEVEYLNKAWEDNLEFAMLKDCCTRTAESLSYLPDGGDPDTWARRPNYKVGTAAGMMALEKAGEATHFLFLPAACFKNTNASPPELVETKLHLGIALEVVTSQQAKLVCACCKKEVNIKNTSLAHNVISQQSWKKIMDASIERFVTVVRQGQLKKMLDSRLKDDFTGKKMRELKDAVGPKAPFNVPSGSAFDVNTYKVHTLTEKRDLKDQYKTELRVTLTDDKQIEKEAEKRIRELKPFGDPRDQELFDRLVAAAMIENSSYAASNQSGVQCRECEEAQGSATLMQRAKLEADGHLPAIQDAHKIKDPNFFVGPQFVTLPQVKTDKEELVRRATLRQISRFLLGIEKTLGDYILNLSKDVTKKPPVNANDPAKTIPPLAALMLEHWDEFVWTFRSVALETAAVPYTGEFGALKFKDGKPQPVKQNVAHQ